MATQKNLADAPASETTLASLQDKLDRLEAANAAQEERIGQLLDRIQAPASVVTLDPTGRAAASDRVQKEQEKLEAWHTGHDASLEKSKAELADGPNRYEVCLVHQQTGKVMNPKAIVGARDPAEAYAKYNKYFGIRGTDHAHDSKQLPSAQAAG